MKKNRKIVVRGRMAKISGRAGDYYLDVITDTLYRFIKGRWRKLNWKL